MEAVIHEALGDILHLDACTIFPLPQIEDTLVRNGAVGALVEDREEGFEALGNVVGIKDGDGTRRGKPIGPHHAEIHPADDADAGASPGSGTDLADCPGSSRRNHGVSRQERGEMLGNADRSDSGTASPVGDAEGLVQIEMAHIGTYIAGTAKADLGIHISPIHIDLTPGFMDQGADFPDRGLKYSMGRGIGDHECCKAVTVERDLCLKIIKIDIPQSIAGNPDDLHSGHGGAGRIRSVGGNRNQTDGAIIITARAMIGPDDKQTCIFTLGTGIGLQ